MISTRWRMPAERSLIARVGIDLEPVLLADLGNAVADVARVELPDVAQGDVLPHGERFDQREVLVHHADAVGRGIDRVLDLDRLAVAAHLRRRRG